MNSYQRKISTTNMFLVPVLKIGRENLMRAGFVEAYFSDKLREIEYENCVYLLFRPARLDEFNLFVESQRENNTLVDEYDHKGYTVLVYKLPAEYKKDYEILMKGKFSQTSQKFQDLLPKYAKVAQDGVLVDEMTTQHLVFEKDQTVKDYWKRELDLDFQPEDEVWHFYEEREILNEDAIKRLTTAKLIN